MTLEEFFEVLSLYDLSQHRYAKVDSSGSIVEPHLIIPVINLGLKDLHRRFLIKKGVVHVCLDPCVRTYCIDDCDRSYLVYDCKPLRLLEILEVLSCDGVPTRLNATHRRVPTPCSNSCMIDIFMPEYDKLEFSVNEGYFRIHYRKDAEQLPNPKYVAKYDPRRIVVDIPETYLDALAYYVCSRLFAVTTPISDPGAALSPALQYKARYEEECQRLMSLGFEVEGTGNYQQRFNDTGMP